MRNTFLALICAHGIFVNGALAQVNAPVVIAPEKLSWTGSKLAPGNEFSSIVGAASKPGLYVLRVKMASGSRIPPHSHPDERHGTVLAGTLWVGFGEAADDSKMVAAPTGSVFVIPPNVAHYLWAKDGEAIFQEAGIGPSATIPVSR